MTDVLIAGAGPTGLAAALRLAQCGVSVVVLERRMQLGRGPRAAAWLPPTLEVFEQLGILGGLLQTGLRAPRIACLRAGMPTPLARFDLSLLEGETRFPFRLHLDQGAVTAALAAALAAWPNVRLAFGTELLRVDQDAAGVTVQVCSALGERVERGAYLLAADGVASAARAGLGIGMQGNVATGQLLEVLTPTDMADLVPGAEAATWIEAVGGCCALMRMPDLWQIAVPLCNGQSAAAALDEPALRARLAGLLPFAGNTLPVIAREVRPVRRQVAASYVSGRVLLAGDAAHMVQTRFGMNMNCGLHDAIAAADALAAALHTPAAADGLLERYGRERRSIATSQLLPHADRGIPGAETWAAELTDAAADPERTRAWLRTACMLDIPGLRTTAAATVAG